MTHVRFTPHPDDRAAVESLIAEFVARRHVCGFSTRELAEQLGVLRASVTTLEVRKPANPRVDTLQAYAEPLSLRLRLELSDLPEVEPTSAVRALLAGGFLGTAMVAQLRLIREHNHWTRPQVQARSGWNWSSIAAFENCDREPHLSMLQRYARALGGRLIPSWEVVP